MSAYFGPWRLVCSQRVPPAVTALARKLVGGMLDVGGIPTRTWKLDDGTVITALIVNGLPNVHVSLPPPVTELPVPFTSLWIPRGFVVYPAWADAPMGVGLPIVQQGSDPYASTNLSPGLTTTRWTAGGPCGEVLLSPDDQAGYPLETVFPAPLLADATAGPQFRWTGPVNVDARVPSSTWAGYRLELAPFRAHFSGENIATQQALFEAVNNVRHTAGQTQALLRFRGFARVAEMAASIFDAAGKDDETSTTYPVTFQSSADRLTKEGYAADWTDAALSSFARSDMFAMYEFRANSQSPADAVNAWKAQSGSILTGNLGSSVVADVGYRNGYSVLALAARDRWIQAGNQNWQSSDNTLPPISWHGFASQNLACETYPAVYTVSGENWVLQIDFPFTNGNGDCWLKYPRVAANAPYDTAKSEPAMGRHIYCRGRSIALAPNGGLVWGACVQKVGDNDRLIALIHHPADQSNDALHEGCTRYLRVWWVDVPPRDGLRLSPQEVICGTATNDTWGWRGGQMIDFGSMPPATHFTASAGANSLMQASQWKFSTDGTHAVCLRSYGAYADYTQPVKNSEGLVWADAIVLQPTPARTVELVFSADVSDLTTQLIVHDFTAGLANAEAETPDVQTSKAPGPLGQPDVTLYDYGVSPLAVDYVGDTYQRVYAYGAQLSNKSAETSIEITYWRIGTGDASIVHASEMANDTLVGCDKKTAEMDFVMAQTLVLDAHSATFAVTGLPFDACWPFTLENVYGVKLCRGGDVVSTDDYPVPDGSVVSYNSIMAMSDTTSMPSNWGAINFCMSSVVQGYYASRFGQLLYGYQVMPVPYTMLAMNAAPAKCSPTWAEALGISTAHQMLGVEAAPRGGKAVSTVSMPANDWLIFAKVV